jgi:hypothetical protein
MESRSLQHNFENMTLEDGSQSALSPDQQLAESIAAYKHLLEDSTVDEKYLMILFDNIIRFAEEDYKLHTCHTLMDCGERKEYKRFNFALKMHDHQVVNTDLILPWKTLPSVDNVMLEQSQHNHSSACGTIEMKCLTNRRLLGEKMEQLLSNSDACFVIWPPLSMNDYDTNGQNDL